MTKRYSLGDLKELIRYSPNDDEGQTYVGRDYVVSTGCSPFFVSELEEHGSMCMQFVRMGVVKSGSCEPVVHSAQYLCREGDLFFAGWGTELTEDAVSPGTFFEGILMTEEYLKKIFGAYLPQVFLSPCQHFMLHLSEAEQDMWHDYLRILYALAIHESFDRKPLNALFISVFRFVQALYESQGKGHTRTCRVAGSSPSHLYSWSTSMLGSITRCRSTPLGSASHRIIWDWWSRTKQKRRHVNG